jgi:hypothetical protein
VGRMERIGTRLAVAGRWEWGGVLLGGMSTVGRELLRYKTCHKIEKPRTNTSQTVHPVVVFK